MEIRLQGQLIAQDYIDAQYLHAGWRLPVRAFGISLLAGALLLLIDPNNTVFWIALLPFIGILTGILILVIRHILARRSRKTFAQQKTLHLEVEKQIDEDGIFSRVPVRGEWKSQWPDFHKWKANEKLVLIYASDRIFYMFPRRWFASDAEFESFQELLARKIGPINKARKDPSAG